MSKTIIVASTPCPSMQSLALTGGLVILRAQLFNLSFSLASYSNAGSLSVVTFFDVACRCVSLSSASFYKVVRLLSILLISTSISCYNGLCTLSQLRTCYINPGRDA